MNGHFPPLLVGKRPDGDVMSAIERLCHNGEARRTVGVAFGLAAVKDATSCDTLAHAPVPVGAEEDVGVGVWYPGGLVPVL